MIYFDQAYCGQNGLKPPTSVVNLHILPVNYPNYCGICQSLQFFVQKQLVSTLPTCSCDQNYNGYDGEKILPKKKNHVNRFVLFLIGGLLEQVQVL